MGVVKFAPNQVVDMDFDAVLVAMDDRGMTTVLAMFVMEALTLL